jgi:hypothetical protein
MPASLGHKRVGHLKQNTGTVSRGRIAPQRPPVAQVHKDLDAPGNDLPGFFPPDVTDHADATGIVSRFKARILHMETPYQEHHRR